MDCEQAENSGSCLPVDNQSVSVQFKSSCSDVYSTLKSCCERYNVRDATRATHLQRLARIYVVWRSQTISQAVLFAMRRGLRNCVDVVVLQCRWNKEVSVVVRTTRLYFQYVVTTEI